MSKAKTCFNWSCSNKILEVKLCQLANPFASTTVETPSNDTTGALH